jgi:hypothetical protein
MGGGEDAVPKQSTVVEETDVGEKLHGRFAILLHNALEFQQVPTSVRVHGHMQILRRGLTGAQQRLATGLDLGRVEHAPQASLRSAIIGADEVDCGLEPLLATEGIGIVVNTSLRIRIRVAVTEGRAGVDAHPQGLYETHIAFPVATLSPNINDSGRAVLQSM